MCDACQGTGWMVEYTPYGREGMACMKCRGRAQLPVTAKEQKQWERIVRAELLTSALQPPPTLIIVNVPNTEASA